MYTTCHNNNYILKVNIELECIASNLKSLKKKFLRVSSQATIEHLKKFIAIKILNGLDKYKDVSRSVLCIVLVYFITKYISVLFKYL